MNGTYEELGAFGLLQGCEALETLIVTAPIVTIGDQYLLSRCSSLTTVGLPGTLYEIQKYVFKDCPLTDIWFDGSEYDWAGVGIGDGNDAVMNAVVHYEAYPLPTPEPAAESTPEPAQP